MGCQQSHLKNIPIQNPTENPSQNPTQYNQERRIHSNRQLDESDAAVFIPVTKNKTVKLQPMMLQIKEEEDLQKEKTDHEEIQSVNSPNSSQVYSNAEKSNKAEIQSIPNKQAFQMNSEKQQKQDSKRGILQNQNGNISENQKIKSILRNRQIMNNGNKVNFINKNDRVSLTERNFPNLQLQKLEQNNLKQNLSPKSNKSNGRQAQVNKKVKKSLSPIQKQLRKIYQV